MLNIISILWLISTIGIISYPNRWIALYKFDRLILDNHLIQCKTFRNKQKTFSQSAELWKVHCPNTIGRTVAEIFTQSQCALIHSIAVQITFGILAHQPAARCFNNACIIHCPTSIISKHCHLRRSRKYFCPNSYSASICQYLYS